MHLSGEPRFLVSACSDVLDDCHIFYAHLYIQKIYEVLIELPLLDRL